MAAMTATKQPDRACWGSQNSNKKKSTFFKGVSIFEQLVNSSFGKIKHAFEELFSDDDVSSYKLPKVIVIGNESTGKSSLLENITKCQIFPRDSKICTKCPIHLKLNNGSGKYNISYNNTVINVSDKLEIYGNIVDIMKKIPDDSISEDEILVTIVDKGLPNFEFYDLPGIRAYPPKSVEITMNLCRKYLQDRNSIVLCVVPATTTRLTACQSIALIQEMRMEHNCILALTMADRLQFENIEELLIKRIVGTSDEVMGLSFAGCVAVVNRLHTDIKSLDENDKLEEKWFAKNIMTKIPSDYIGYEDTIENNVGIENLLCRMDELYEQFIQADWKPKLLASISTKIEGFTDELESMGIDISKINISEVNRKLNDFIKHSKFCQYLPEIECEEGSDWFEHYYNIVELVDNLTEDYDEKKVQFTEFCKQIELYFNNNPPLKLERFSKVKNSILAILLQKYNDTAKNNKQIKQKVIMYLDLHVDSINTSTIRELYDQFYLLFRLQPLKQIQFILTLDDFVENDEYKEKRKLLAMKIQRATDHKAKISNI